MATLVPAVRRALRSRPASFCHNSRPSPSGTSPNRAGTNGSSRSVSSGRSVLNITSTNGKSAAKLVSPTNSKSAMTSRSTGTSTTLCATNDPGIDGKVDRQRQRGHGGQHAEIGRRIDEPPRQQLRQRGDQNAGHQPQRSGIDQNLRGAEDQCGEHDRRDQFATDRHRGLPSVGLENAAIARKLSGTNSVPIVSKPRLVVRSRQRCSL